MSVTESEVCQSVDFGVEGQWGPVETRVWRHAPVVSLDHTGIWAVRCLSCGEPMRGSARDRQLLIEQLQGQIASES